MALGEAIRVSNVRQFGVNESQPQGLAGIGSTLYMVGTLGDNLYTVNRSTGVATLVNNQITAFGVGELTPTGLTSIGNTLYMVGQTNRVLYEVDPQTGMATRVGNVENFGANETAPLGLGSIGETLYLTGNITDSLLIISRVDGRATAVGGRRFGIAETQPGDLASVGDTLYMASRGLDALVSVTPVTPPVGGGTATRIGNAEAFGVGERFPTGLTVIDGIMYMVGSSNATLYTVQYSDDPPITDDPVVPVSGPLNMKLSDLGAFATQLREFVNIERLNTETGNEETVVDTDGQFLDEIPIIIVPTRSPQTILPSGQVIINPPYEGLFFRQHPGIQVGDIIERAGGQSKLFVDNIFAPRNTDIFTVGLTETQQ